MRMPPVIADPVARRVSDRSPIVVKRPRPIVPPAPGMLTTWALPTRPAERIACCCSRTKPSQPPPGPAGAMRVRFAVMSGAAVAFLTDTVIAATTTTAVMIA